MKKGFTLIELLIVVAIIAILAAIAIPNFLLAQTRSKVSRAKGEERSMVLALNSYYVDNNAYPDNSDNNVYEIQMGGVPILTTPIPYMSSMPDSEPFPQWPHPYDGYRYWNYKDEVDYYNREYGTNYYCPDQYWVVSSNGPDRREFNPQEPYRTQYDPTNGVVSGGNIDYFGPSFGFTNPQWGL